MNLLHQRTAVVTGAAQGIGRAIAAALLREGARVVLADRNGTAVRATALHLGPPTAALATACDVTDPDAVARLADTTREAFGPADIVVNNAGIVRDASLRRMTVDDLRSVLDVHLVGAWLVTKSFAEGMRERGGSIINMSSIAGKVGNPGQTNYSAAKAGLVGMTKAAAKELARHDIRVNAVQPGLVRTPMTEAMPAEVWQAKLDEIPLGRAGEPEEVADVVVFLASDLSRYMTGCVLEVAGGRHM